MSVRSEAAHCGITESAGPVPNEEGRSVHENHGR